MSSNRTNCNFRDKKSHPIPRVVGSRQLMTVLLPVPDVVYTILPKNETITFKVTPVFFNIGINEKATLSETLGYTREQHRSNWDNFDRLKQYHIRFKKLNLTNATAKSNVGDLLTSMEESLRTNASKNVRILHLAEDISRGMQGIRLTSCKSAKDRTAMAVTLEQCRILEKEFHLPSNNIQTVLDTIRRYFSPSPLPLKHTRNDSISLDISVRELGATTPTRTLACANTHSICRKCCHFHKSTDHQQDRMGRPKLKAASMTEHSNGLTI